MPTVGGLLLFKDEASESLRQAKSSIDLLGRQSVSNDTFSTQSHKLQKLQAEVDFQRKQFSVEKLESINEALEQLENVKYECNVMKMNLALKGDQEDLDACLKKFKLYA